MKGAIARANDLGIVPLLVASHFAPLGQVRKGHFADVGVSYDFLGATCCKLWNGPATRL